MKRFNDDNHNKNTNMIKKNGYRPIAWALLTLATVAWINPAIANEINPTTNRDYFNGESSIEIEVTPPEEETPIPIEPNIPGNVCYSSLEPGIQRIIGQYPNSWGILVESLTDGTVLYSHNADRFFIPASNTKIFTTAAALQQLDPQGSIGNKSVKSWITTTNLNSNNYYADTLFRYIGGFKIVKAALTRLGVDPSGYRLNDGSGLSRNNVATPRTIVSVLRAMYYSPQRDVFYDSLPTAGVSGTLRRRMRQTPAEGIVKAKTGTLYGVRALSGYMNHPQKGMLVFSILVNNSSKEGSSLVSSIDRIVLQVSNLNSCQ